MKKEQAIDLYRQFNIAMAADDVAALEKLLAPGFSLTHMTGYVQSRAEWLGQIKDGQMHYFSSREESVVATAIADGWQVTGRNRVLADINGGGKHEWGLNTVMPVGEINGERLILKAVVTPY